MGRQMDNRKNGGFSLAEVLAVTAIFIILLSFSAVGVAHHRDFLKIAELDNAAREIYMAAGNRAVLLNNGSQMNAILAEAASLSNSGEAASLCYIRKTDPIAEKLLPAGTVDPALLEGDFYIVYDLTGSAVTDVFYTEDPSIQNIADLWPIAGDRDARMRSRPMFGCYGGRFTPRKTCAPLPAPEVMVSIRNEEQLTLEVTFSIPDAALSLTGSSWSYTAEQRVRITCGGQTRFLLALNTGESTVRSPGRRSDSITSVTYSWVLDALDGADRHFYQLFDKDGTGPDLYGGDFTVTAEITLSAAGYQSASASGSDTNNSLFARGSGGSTARIETLRHLQNLDAGTSKAGGKTAAVQLSDIHCYDNPVYPDYTFIPIENRDLVSFDGGRNTHNERNQILSLRVTGRSASGKEGAGFFAGSDRNIAFTGIRLMDARISSVSQPAGALIGTAPNGFQAEDVRIINTSVRSDTKPAGGLAGHAAGTSSLKNCRVCWEPETGQKDLRSLLGSNITGYQYKITGTHAGGLIGIHEGSQGGLTITGSFASTAIRGTAQTGGLIGSSHDASAVLKNSYADCYLSGGEAAGLIGHQAGETHITNCYAAGWIDMTAVQKAAGLCLGESPIAAENTYSAMAYSGSSAGKRIFKLDERQEASLFLHTYYLGGAGESFERSDGGAFPASSYEQMSAPEFAPVLGTAFAFKESQSAAASRKTCAYNLREPQRLRVYSFPGLSALPHYGDWQTYFLEPGLVFWEAYPDGTRGFTGSSVRRPLGQLDSQEAVSDGCAAALRQVDLEGMDAVEITCTSLKTVEGVDVTVRQTVSYGFADLLPAVWTRPDSVQEAFLLAPLPQELMAGGGSEDVFQYLYLEVVMRHSESGSGFSSGEFFYNSHTKTVQPYVSADNVPLADWTDWSDGAEAPSCIRQYSKRNLSPPDGGMDSPPA